MLSSSPKRTEPATSEAPYGDSMGSPGGRLRDANGLVVGQWSSGLCSCFESVVPNCLWAFCCPCVSLAQTVARLGLYDYVASLLVFFLLYASGFGALLAWLFLWYFRYKFRTWFRLEGSCVADCCATLCCPCCVLAQLATHAGSYDPGACHLEAKRTLPGYTDMLRSNGPPGDSRQPSTVV
ncbi:hypothetical protein LEN26_000271 [Aphanomyces euteiches]|nr:hypothetical protein AeMF1_019081 [Aphanomyces euteiches]KAH9163912.1 hypothetical protein LEN26_000271 [Aphanomyces euteiches]KAH9197005.1 hypothetical protein AeNC1_001036 [Aphanomyces euteiches]